MLTKSCTLSDTFLECGALWCARTFSLNHEADNNHIITYVMRAVR